MIAATEDTKWNLNNKNFCMPAEKAKNMPKETAMNDSSDEERDEGTGEILHCTFAGCLKGRLAGYPPLSFIHIQL
jgi:hypothetical protein